MYEITDEKLKEVADYVKTLTQEEQNKLIEESFGMWANESVPGDVSTFSHFVRFDGTM